MKKIITKFLEWIANKRLEALFLEPRYETLENPLPWINTWISAKGESGDVQVAPQETEISSYIIGSVLQDVEKDTFKDLKI